MTFRANATYARNEVVEEVMPITEVHFSKLELLLRKQGAVFQFATLEFAERDVSVYIHVDAPTGHFFYGTETIPAGQQSLTFNFANQHRTDDPRVHLSIHQSGQVHARVKRTSSTTPVYTVELPSFNGEHAATLLVDNLDALRPSAYQPGASNELYRLALDLSTQTNSARVAIYLNGYHAHFADHCPIIIRMIRPKASVFFGLRPMPQAPLGAEGISGVLVISGIKPVPLEEPLPFVFLRGQ